MDFTLPDLVDTLAAKALPLEADKIEAVRRELDAKDAGGLVDAGGEAYLPLLTAIGPFDTAIERLAAIDAGGALASRIAALRELAAPQVRVWRDGRRTVIPARELVPGDWIAVGEGERVAADAVLREASALSVDESLLTGESAPVMKRPAASAGEGVEPQEDACRIHAGTLVVAGEGLAEVTATGAATAMGRIGASLADIDIAPTPLQQHLRQLVRWLALGALALSSLLVLWHGLRAGDWMQGLLAGIALAMAMLPEEFPMALAVFLALGAWRLARVQVLARRPAVVEALGAATVLCVDKTGTLTENRMAVAELLLPGGAAGAR